MVVGRPPRGQRRTESVRPVATRSCLVRTLLALTTLVAVTAGCTNAPSSPTTGAVTSLSQSTSDGAISAPSLMCPPDAPRATDAPLGASKADVPVPGKVDAALICRYAGMNRQQPYGSLLSHDVATDAKALADILNAGKRVGRQPYNCPFDDGSIDVVRFSDSDGSTADVRVALRGCPIVASLTFDTSARWFLGDLLELLSQHAN